jgi:hypothetical protein
MMNLTLNLFNNLIVEKQKHKSNSLIPEFVLVIITVPSRYPSINYLLDFASCGRQVWLNVVDH